MKTCHLIDSCSWQGQGKPLPPPTPTPQGSAAPSEVREHWSYFQIFPGKGAHDMIRQSFPVSPNPRHSCSQTFPAAPEVNLPWSVSALSALALHTPEASCCITVPAPPTPLSFRAEGPGGTGWEWIEGLERPPLKLQTLQREQSLSRAWRTGRTLGQ